MRVIKAVAAIIVGTTSANAQSPPVNLGNLLGQGYQITTAQPSRLGGIMFFIVQKGDKAYYCQVLVKNFGPTTIAAAPCAPIPSG
jgi:hypothetical protein